MASVVATVAASLRLTLCLPAGSAAIIEQAVVAFAAATVVAAVDSAIS